MVIVITSYSIHYTKLYDHIGLGHALQRYVRSQVEQDQAPVETLIDCDTRRPLRIGFLSPDLKTHSVAYFLLPLLKQLRQKQEVCRITSYNVCYTKLLRDITVSIDKIEKLGIDQVNEELRARGVGDEAISYNFV